MKGGNKTFLMLASQLQTLNITFSDTNKSSLNDNQWINDVILLILNFTMSQVSVLLPRMVSPKFAISDTPMNNLMTILRLRQSTLSESIVYYQIAGYNRLH